MHLEELEKTFFAAARALPAKDEVPYAFEKRVMAALGARSSVDPWAVWSRLLWRAAAPCVAIMVVMSVWTVVAAQSNHVRAEAALAADLEGVVWAPLSSIHEIW